MTGAIQLSGGKVAERLPPEQQEQYKKDFPGVLGKIIRIKPCGTVVKEAFRHYDEEIYNFGFRSDDVIVMTHPKCGTTWTQEIIWTMRNNPNLDNPNSDEPNLTKSPCIELDFFLHDEIRKVPFDMFLAGDMFSTYKTRCPNLDPERGINIQVAESYTEPRVLKTHLPFSFYKPGLIDTCKIVLVLRHPKDAMLSYLHHSRLINIQRFVSTQDVFIKYYVEEMTVWSSYSNLVKEAMQLKSHPNLHIMHYEDMKADIGAELRRLDDFLGTKLTEKQLKNVEEQTSFSTMQKNDPVKTQTTDGYCVPEVLEREGGFIHKGQVGVWKSKLTQEQNALMDKYIAEKFDYPELKARYQ